jgi:hypothetical protein
MAANHFQRFGPASALILSGVAVVMIGRGLMSSQKHDNAEAKRHPHSAMTKPVAKSAAGAGARESSAPRSLDTDAGKHAVIHKHCAATLPESGFSGNASFARTSKLGPDAGRPNASHSAHRHVADIPFSFSIPDERLVAGSPEEEALYQAQARFADELNSLTDSDPASPEYAARWNRSAASHDDYLRLRLGGPAYVQLTAVAMQAEQSARERGR